MASTTEVEVPVGADPTTLQHDTAEQKKKSQTKVRKRAAKACLSCRARKVRCDVSQRGRPCMNCYLDSETCVVTCRASRFSRTHREGDGFEASHPPYPRDQAAHGPSAETVAQARAGGQSVPSTESRGDAEERRNSSHTADATENRHQSPPEDRAAHVREDDPRRPRANYTFKPVSKPDGLGFDTSFPPHEKPADSSARPWAADQSFGMNTDVTYSFYPFLKLGNIANIPPQDVNYLELQGCLRVPTRSLLDEFVQQYFLHVHPLLPMIDEGDFWDMYGEGTNTAGRSSKGTMSLLVFQSMLFASCNFVSRQAVRALGYSSIRSARATMHRRCKLLHDLDTESSPIAISQAALLLTYWTAPMSSGPPRKQNSAWLNVAIQQAKTAEAHHYAALTPDTRHDGSVPHTEPDAAQLKKQNVLKRLWWCCLIRDRIIGLGLRRSLQITRSHFDLDTNSILGFSDLAGEAERSRVYNADTKRCLAEILEQLVELCVILTDILILVFPLDDRPGWGREMKVEEQEKLRECKVTLRRWYKGATLRFPALGGGTMASVGGRRGREFHHDSVILYTNLMYMYYHSSRVVLSHHEVLHLAITASAPSFNTIPTRDLAVIGENRHELQDAASGVTECLKELINLRLARWLPISAVACTALPLVLHILDVKLSSPDKARSRPSTESAAKQHRLNILIEAMKIYQWQYDGVDCVSDTTRHIINLAQLDPPAAAADHPEGPDRPVSDWTDILASQPSSYLRLALTMDLSLSKGRIPEDADFPAGLRGLFSAGFNPIRLLLEQKRRDADALAAASAAAQPFPTHFASPRTFQALHAADFDAGTLHPSVFTLHPGTVTAISSASDSTSPEDHSPDARSSTSPQTQRDVDVMMGEDAQQPPETIARVASELMAEAMDVFPMDGTSPGAGSDMDGFHLGSSEDDSSRDWMERVWGDVERADDEADRNTALALLEALKETEAATLMVH